MFVFCLYVIRAWLNSKYTPTVYIMNYNKNHCVDTYINDILVGLFNVSFIQKLKTGFYGSRLLGFFYFSTKNSLFRALKLNDCTFFQGFK